MTLLGVDRVKVGAQGQQRCGGCGRFRIEIGEHWQASISKRPES